jgi:chorismate--pyruvate lyase
MSDWHKSYWLRSYSLSPAERAWLRYKKSMTKRLRKYAGEDLAIEVTQAGWQRGDRYEHQILQVPLGQRFFIREVNITCNHNICMFARTTIPASSFSGKLKFLRHLGTKPLGNVLFADPSLTRSEFSYTLLPRSHELFIKSPTAASNQVTALWARYSVFMLKSERLLLTEVFLPPLVSTTC